MNENRSSSGEPQSHEVFINFAPGALSHGAHKSMIMKISLILKANVEWHNNSANESRGTKDNLTLIDALLSILASLLNIICR